MKPAYFVIIRDTLLLMPRLLYSALLVLLARVFVQPASRLQKFTSVAWLADHLDLDPQLIEGARIEEVHTGTASRSRLHIRYAEHLTTAPGPTSLFIKSSPPDFGSALFGVLFDLGLSSLQVDTGSSVFGSCLFDDQGFDLGQGHPWAVIDFA